MKYQKLKYPDWNTNNGVGSWAAEFVLDNINSLEYLEEDEEISYEDRIKEILGLNLSFLKYKNS